MHPLAAATLYLLLRCTDLPPRLFLSAGATFTRIASYKGSTLASALDLVIGPDSPLYAALCAAAAPLDAGCTFPPEVSLAAKLPCHAAECNVTGGIDVASLLNGTSFILYILYTLYTLCFIHFLSRYRRGLPTQRDERRGPRALRVPAASLRPAHLLPQPDPRYLSSST